MSLRRRLPTAVILMAALVAALEWAPPLAFFALLQIFVLAGLLEFYGLAKRRKIDVRPVPVSPSPSCSSFPGSFPD